MYYQDIMTAVKDGDTEAIRAAFRALVDFPHEAPVEAAGPGPLVIALKTVSDALEADDAVMPRGTCEALEAPPGSPYAKGAAIAKAHAMRIAGRYRKHFERRAG